MANQSVPQSAPTPQGETNIYDLMYMADASEWQRLQAEILETYPDATFEDARDFIHHDRHAVRVNDDHEQYMVNALKWGCYDVSLILQMEAIANTAYFKTLCDRAVNELRAARKGGDHE